MGEVTRQSHWEHIQQSHDIMGGSHDMMRQGTLHLHDIMGAHISHMTSHDQVR